MHGQIARINLSSRAVSDINDDPTRSIALKFMEDIGEGQYNLYLCIVRRDAADRDTQVGKEAKRLPRYLEGDCCWRAGRAERTLDGTRLRPQGSA